MLLSKFYCLYNQKKACLAVGDRLVILIMLQGLLLLHRCAGASGVVSV